MSISRWRDKQIVVYPSNVSNKNKWTTDTCNDIDGAKNVTLSERNQDNEEYVIWFYLTETLEKTNLACGHRKQISVCLGLVRDWLMEHQGIFYSDGNFILIGVGVYMSIRICHNLSKHMFKMDVFYCV